LHGYTKGHPPRQPGQALEAFLRALGVPAAQIPADLEEGAALYRQQLADAKTLIVLDNAVDEAQVRPLLPGAPGCLVLVTSRRRLKGLDDARSVSLDLLPSAHAAALLRSVAGPGRITVGDPLLDDVAQLCGNLPLALRIAGALLRHRPAWTLEHLAGLLRDPHRRVHALSDGERDLAAVLDLSYTALDGAHRSLFRHLGLVLGLEADAYAAAALLESDPDTATGLLEDLVDHNLLIAHAPGRYRLHDLIRAHAVALAERDPDRDRATALDRLLRYYAHTAQSASLLIAARPRSAPGSPPPAHAPSLTGPEAARAWLRTERDNLEAAHAHACVGALDEHVITLAAGLAEILRTDAPATRSLAVHQAAAESAERLGVVAARAGALTELGHILRYSGDVPAAADAANRALELYRAAGDRDGEANALEEFGIARGIAGDEPAAAEALERALEIYREVGNASGEAGVLAELGAMRQDTGDLSAAADALTQALEIFRAIGNRRGEGGALTDLGLLRERTGDLSAATDAFTQALEIFRAIGHASGEATMLLNLGTVWRRTGDLQRAIEAQTQALDIFRTIGPHNGEAYTLTDLGRTRRDAGDLLGAADAALQAIAIFQRAGARTGEAEALNVHAAIVAANGDLPRAFELYRRALAMNRELNKPDDEAISLEGLGECHLAAGEPETGTDHLSQALEIFHQLGMTPDVERVRTRLANLDTA
jgi:tetratricopeptide (TPR) repeat protein